MKKSFAMIYTIFLIIFVSFMVLSAIKIASYPPRIMKDLIFYTQGKIILFDAVELSKYFLYEARTQDKECLDEIKFNYNQAVVKIDYVYPLAKCDNGKIITDYENPNSIIAINVSVLLNANQGVNEEVFLQKSFFIYPKFDEYRFELQ
ncbi:hypothetical protein IY972_02040 [Campylobacter volucris]|uniref:hypothetical protein n=1 Tax=Campylobacter volucris TaxID=1031542 RepID=UPI00189F8059|nr:hypothetical protein [Campylobacter volucris]MBF7049247.1 hypothetical protein [Campylobacter volucris]MBF7059694.1 hypothetical protein [Campylobacter volucris]